MLLGQAFESGLLIFDRAFFGSLEILGLVNVAYFHWRMEAAIDIDLIVMGSDCGRSNKSHWVDIRNTSLRQLLRDRGKERTSMLLRHQETASIFIKTLYLMLTKLIQRHLLLGSWALLEIGRLDWYVWGACIADRLRCVIRHVLLIGSDCLTIHSRLMLLFERVDVRQQRRYQILLLLIGGHSGLSRDVLDKLANVRLHRCCTGLHLLMAVIGIDTNKRKMSIARRTRAHLIEQRLMRLGRSQWMLVLMLDIRCRRSRNICTWQHILSHWYNRRMVRLTILHH